MDYKFVLTNGDELIITRDVVAKVSVMGDGHLIAWNDSAEIVFAASPGGWQYIYQGNATVEIGREEVKQ